MSLQTGMAERSISYFFLVFLQIKRFYSNWKQKIFYCQGILQFKNHFEFFFPFFQDSPVGSAESSGSSGLSNTVPRPLDLGMASIRQDVLSRTGSAPTSPKTSLITSAGTTPAGAGSGGGGGILSIGIAGPTGNSSAPNAPSCPQTQPLNLASQRPSHYNVELLRGISGGGGVNSKSLPNIPSAMVRKDKGGHVGRKSPPTSAASGATKQMLVRRSKSSAILPLRKHLIGEFLKVLYQKICARAPYSYTFLTNSIVSTRIVCGLCFWTWVQGPFNQWILVKKNH